MDDHYRPGDYAPVHVYFIEDVESKQVKIGRYSGPPLKRLSELQTANPRPLRLLGVARGIPPHEREMHRRLKDHRTTGEWFNLPDGIRQFVESLPDGAALLDHAAIPDLAPIPNVTLLLFQTGFTYREIADFFGCSRTTICSAIPSRYRPKSRWGLSGVKPTVSIEECYESLAATFDVLTVA